MKHVIGLIILGWSIPLYGQAVFNLDSLPVQGIVLDHGWRWHSGDNSTWAILGINDQRWLTVDPSQDIMSLPQIRQTNMGWLRLHLQVDSALRGQVISLLIDQQVASQIYLNGRLIGGFGRVSTNPNQVVAYNPGGSDQALWQTTHFQLGSSTHQVLAIRFALQPGIYYLREWGKPNPLLLAKLFRADQHNQYRVDSKGNFDATFLDYFKAGLFIILALLHLFFYVWYPLQRVNFWFGLNCLLWATCYVLQPIVYQYVHSVASRMNFYILGWILIFGAQLTFLLAVYSLSAKRVSVFFYFVLTVFGIYLLLFVFQLNPSQTIGLLLILILYIESVRQLLLVSRKRGGEYRILTVGTVIFVGLLISYISVPFLGVDAETKIVLAHLFYNLNALSLPVSLTLFLASRFAQTYRTLADKLVQVKALSAQTVAQEQEKQQLLATQNEHLELQVTARTAELSQSLANLKRTQDQLVQKEKMASLGELTAGIAHEIQNPLNFVNNFAEVSTEVIDELSDGPVQHVPALYQAEAQELLAELKQNLTKIAHHGGRAAAIVRGMLEHSRTSSGDRQPTDLNALVREYLTIAYQGYRTTHPQFNCQLVEELDQNQEPVSLVPQDLGRVLLNLCSNAFYAVEQRQKAAGSSYQPRVRVQSRRLANGVQLRIEDNGLGIDKELRTKIFQPFFTTKPTGQGTGLGLSLSFDIITKGHGGELYIDSQPGQSTVFVIFIPTALSTPTPIFSSHSEPAQ